MNIKIVNKNKFVRSMLLIIILVLSIILLLSNNTYSKEKIEYKEIYINRGDTLWKIASEQIISNSYYKNKDIRYVVTDLKNINNVNNKNLNIGDKLLIPFI